MAEATQNPIIPVLVGSIIDLLREQRKWISLVNGDLQRGQSHHKKILEAVMKYDPQAARQAMQDHLVLVRKDSDTCNIAGRWLTARTFPKLLWQAFFASIVSNIFKISCALSSSPSHPHHKSRPAYRMCFQYRPRQLSDAGFAWMTMGRLKPAFLLCYANGWINYRSLWFC